VVDRESIFSHPEVQALLKAKFVNLAMNDWYMRRQEDAEGVFFRKMTEASPRGNAGQATRQGRYVFTAAGKFLGFNNNRSVERMLQLLQDSLTTWETLPEADKYPAESPTKGPVDRKYNEPLPAGGAIVKVHTRVLHKTADGTYQAVKLAPDQTKLENPGFAAATDHLWLQPAEVAALRENTVPAELLRRLTRYHLVDNTRGEPPSWKPQDIKIAKLSLKPESAGKSQLLGEFSMETADGKRGCKLTLEGSLTWEGEKLSQLEAVVLGEHWGEGTYTRNAREGHQPIGFSLRFVPNPRPEDLVRPQFSHWLKGYWTATE
jgi:hypothetical protein